LNSKYQFTGEMRVVECSGFQFTCLLFLSDFDQLWTVLTTAVNIFITICVDAGPQTDGRTDRRRELYRRPEYVHSVLTCLVQAAECD